MIDACFKAERPPRKPDADWLRRRLKIRQRFHRDSSFCIQHSPGYLLGYRYPENIRASRVRSYVLPSSEVLEQSMNCHAYERQLDRGLRRIAVSRTRRAILERAGV